ncbi:MAG: Tab2 family RNA-binding protein [Dolichospermum sp.]
MLFCLRVQAGISSKLVQKSVSNLFHDPCSLFPVHFVVTVAKEQANGVHFIGVQSDSQSQDFAGFWLLQEINLP